MKHILFIIPGLSPGGAEINCLRIARAINQSTNETGIRCSIALLNSARESISRSMNELFDEYLRDTDVFNLGIGTRDLSFPDKIKRLCEIPLLLRAEIRKINPDLVVSFLDQINILTLLSLINSPTAAFVCERINPLRTSLPDKTPALARLVFIFLRNVIYRFAEKIIVQTHDAKLTLPDYLSAKTFVIPNSAPAIQHNEIPRERYILGVGRLVRQKRFDLLIEAFALFHNTHPEWRLAIAGDGQERDNLIALSQKLGVKESVNFLGNSDNLPDLYARCSIFALTSDYEGFPTVLLEAIAAGCPVVSTDCDFGARDILEWSNAGFLVPTGSAFELALKFSLIAESTEVIEELEIGRRKVLEYFSEDRVKAKWIELFKS